MSPRARESQFGNDLPVLPANDSLSANITILGPTNSSNSTEPSPKCLSMPDPRKVSAERAGRRIPRRVRLLGWALAVVAWAIASEARPLLAVLSVVAAAVIRGVYVITTGWGKGRSVFGSSWFFAVAALCEIVWLAVNR